MRRLALVALISVAAQSCFYYDSRWGQAEAEQRRTAKRHTPVRLGSASGSGSQDLERPPSSELRALRLRAYADSEHAAETMDWQQQLQQNIEAANAVLGELGVRLTLERATAWQPATGSGTLEEILEALRKFDTAADADFVLALTGSLPRVEFSFHQLGMAGLLGKHLVVRAMNDAAEHKAIERNLDELNETERQKLYQDRKRHKNAAVLLHELGHALGALHVNNPKDLMHPRYSPEASDFGIETRALLEIALRYPEYASNPRQQLAVIDESLAELKARQTSAWVAGERQSQIALLEKARAQAPKQAPTPRGACPKPPPRRLVDRRAAVREVSGRLCDPGAPLQGRESPLAALGANAACVRGRDGAHAGLGALS